jgi:hypothetical protein
MARHCVSLVSSSDSLSNAHFNPLRPALTAFPMEIFDPGHKEVPFARFRRHFPNFEAVCKAIDDEQIAKVKEMFAEIPEIWRTKDASFSTPLVCHQPNAILMNICLLPSAGRCTPGVSPR